MKIPDSNEQLIFIILTVACCFSLTYSVECPADRSRSVRQVVQDSILPIYTSLELEIPSKCPLSSERDMYSHQEKNIFEESSSKWICQFCGKSFYEIRFLDMHFMNRHPESLKADSDATCLSDYCDVFRCDVLSGRHQPRYWDVALCNEKDMNTVQTRCKTLLEQCMPTDTDHGRLGKLTAGLNETLCDYLTCNKYWELPVQEMNPVSTALYIIFSLFLAFGLMVYYYIIYTHFYTDDSILTSGNRKSSYQGSPYPNHRTQEMRYRSNLRYT